jgi:isopentenyl phosphate kinase
MNIENENNSMNFDFNKFKTDFDNIVLKVLENIEENRELKALAFKKVKEGNNIDDLTMLERLQTNIELSAKNLADIYLISSKVYDNLSKTINNNSNNSKVEKKNDNSKANQSTNKFAGLF